MVTGGGEARCADFGTGRWRVLSLPGRIPPGEARGEAPRGAIMVIDGGALWYGWPSTNASGVTGREAAHASVADWPFLPGHLSLRPILIERTQSCASPW